jgi:ankyrin repeat protein
MIFLYLIAIISSSFLAMDRSTKNKTAEFQNLSLADAKNRISTAVAFDESYDLKILLQLFGDQLSQEEKNEYLLRCYARPHSTPLILGLGANPNVHNECKCISSALSGLPNSCKKYSILHKAAERGNPDVVKALLKYNAHVNALDNKQETALMKACRLQQINGYRGDNRYIDHYMLTIEHLLNAGADETLTNAVGKTAFQIAQTEIAHLELREIIVTYLSKQKLR